MAKLSLYKPKMIRTILYHMTVIIYSRKNSAPLIFINTRDLNKIVKPWPYGETGVFYDYLSTGKTQFICR